MRKKAVFLDRDGVIVADQGLVTHAEQFVLLEGVPEALGLLKHGGFQLVLTTNQAVVARGLISERELCKLHDDLQKLLIASGAPALDGIYACPHHPNANDPRYRIVCDCRKPRPGLLLKAAEETGIDLGRSFMVGDRLTDIAAGRRAGCRTILVETGQHLAAAIETAGAESVFPPPDHVEPNLHAAARRIVASL